MTLDEFKASVASGDMPSDLSNALQGLWIEAGGNWDTAHEAVQSDDGREAAWVHAYLHRKEPDESNARYWYKRSGEPFFDGSFEAEWDAIARALLAA